MSTRSCGDYHLKTGGLVIEFPPDTTLDVVESQNTGTNEILVEGSISIDKCFCRDYVPKRPKIGWEEEA